MMDASLLVVSMHINNAPEWCVEYEGNLKLGVSFMRVGIDFDEILIWNAGGIADTTSVKYPSDIGM